LVVEGANAIVMSKLRML